MLVNLTKEKRQEVKRMARQILKFTKDGKFDKAQELFDKFPALLVDWDVFDELHWALFNVRRKKINPDVAVKAAEHFCEVVCNDYA